MRFGAHRLWCPETINEVIGIDERHVSVRGHSSLFVWDHRTGALVDGIDARSVPSGDPSMIRVDVAKRAWLKVSPDGKWVVAREAATALGFCERTPDQRRIRVRDAQTLAVTRELGFDFAIDAFAVSADGKRIALTDDATLVVDEL